ncbi:MAG: 4Fe-4S binding protein [Myxococcales bacterium]|nr:4Fe-4S binding protein [Myxococcales bacterium]
MGHLSLRDPHVELQKRLDKNPIGAPATEELFEILRLRFSDEEAQIGARMPMTPAPLALLSRRTGEAPERLEAKLDRMAEKGLVLDFETKGRRFFMLAPTVIGFFEFTFMRLHKDLPNKKLADLLSVYMHDDTFAHNAFRGDTQIGRALVHEKALSDDVRAEILPYEQTSEILKKAELRAVGLCYCRHKAEHHGTPCKKPMETCTTLNENAEWVIRRGYGREVSAEEALDIAARTRDERMVHIGDNVKNNVSYICHCCGCCCGQLSAISRNGIRNAVHTSNYMAGVDAKKCKACGRCVKSCPVMAIEIKATGFGEASARVDEEMCLGCGVCNVTCKNGAMNMTPRAKRVFTPEDNMDRLVRAAVERGTIHHMLFDDPDSVSSRGMNLALGVLLALPPAKQLLAIEQVKSTFVKTIVGAARKRAEAGSARAESG